MNTRNNSNQHLFRLGELDDYKVAKEDPDVRGWRIVDSSNRELGRVEELIVDVDKEKVRYLDVVPSGETSNVTRDEEHHILLPIGVAELDLRDDRVIINGVDRSVLDTYPPYRGEPITRDYEYTVIERFNGPGRRDSERVEKDFYENRLYDEDRFYTNRTRNKPL